MPGDPADPPGEPAPSDTSATAIRRRRAATFAFEETAPVTPPPAGGDTPPLEAEPLAAQIAPAPAIPPPALPPAAGLSDGAAGAAASAPDTLPAPTNAPSEPSKRATRVAGEANPPNAIDLSPIDDAAPTRIINPLIAPTKIVPAEGDAADLEQRAAAPTVMKSLGTRIQGDQRDQAGQGDPGGKVPGPAKLSRVPRSTTSVKRVDGLESVGDDRRNTHDLNLLFPKRDESRKKASDVVPAAKPSGSNRIPAATGPLRIEDERFFGDLELLKQLTSGGFGEVWIAKERESGREVVLKRLKPEQAENKRAYYQFDIEIEIGTRIKHPNLAPVLQNGMVEGRRFFTMPRILGPSMTRILAGRAGAEWALTEAEMLAALEAVARALGFLHRAGVVHCDVKPDNILFAARNRPILIDLGIARTVNWEQTGFRALKGYREDKSILGTPEYMAPEMFGGDPNAIGFPADLYAMGVILYELLAGRQPFQRIPDTATSGGTTSLMELVGRVQVDAAPPLQKLKPQVPAALAELTMACLAKKPEDRPKNADELAVAIARVLRPIGPASTKHKGGGGGGGAIGRLTRLLRKPK